MYSVRRSRNAACACLFRCLRSSDVAYICIAEFKKQQQHRKNTTTNRLAPSFSFLDYRRILRVRAFCSRTGRFRPKLRGRCNRLGTAPWGSVKGMLELRWIGRRRHVLSLVGMWQPRGHDHAILGEAIGAQREGASIGPAAN